jgi:hypothetical protein
LRSRDDAIIVTASTKKAYGRRKKMKEGKIP